MIIVVNVTLAGGGVVAVDGSYKVCEDKTAWSGGGDLTAGISVGGEVAAKVPNVIVLNGEIKGSTSITEKLRMELTDLKITTNWGGLIGRATGTIRIFRKEISFETSRSYFEKDNLLPVTIPLPSLK